MERFDGRIAVLTGAGTGMGRELARQLAAEGCHVSMCDVSAENMDETRRLCESGAPEGARVTTFVADVSDEAQVRAFRDHVSLAHGSDQIQLLFNNAGVNGGSSFVQGSRQEWDRTFAINWGGVYHCTRAFLPMMVASSEGHIVNTSSVNGFWAALGAGRPHTAYSASKFAVKGFSEALLQDLRTHAPHVKVSVVLPGHVGTSIYLNSERIHGRDIQNLSAEQIAALRERIQRMGLDVSAVDDDRLKELVLERAEGFIRNAPLTAEQAAQIILEGVRKGTWRILVGHDAQVLDRMVRESPDQAYEPDFIERLTNEARWQLGGGGGD